MEHERQAFRRGQRLQHGHQRQADGVGEQRLVLGFHGVGAVDHGVGHVHLQGFLGVGAAGAQDVEADPGDDGRQPAAEVVDLVGVAALQPQPRLLHGVVGFAERAEHAVAHGPQAGPVLLELLGQPDSSSIRVTSLRAVVSTS